MVKIELNKFSKEIEKAIDFLKNDNFDLFFPNKKEDEKLKEITIYALEKLNKDNESSKCKECLEDLKCGYLGSKLKEDGFIQNGWISIKKETPIESGNYEITILKYDERLIEIAEWKNDKFQQWKLNCFESFEMVECDDEILAWRKSIPFTE